MASRSGIVDRPVLVTVVFSLLVLLGAFLAFQLNVALFPEINPPVVVVSTTYAGAGPQTVEKSVTKTLEASLINVASLKKITSTSSENVSTVVLQFDYGYNLDTATNDVRDKLDHHVGVPARRRVRPSDLQVRPQLPTHPPDRHPGQPERRGAA